MILVGPPDKPSNFDHRTREARDAVQQAIDAGERPNFDAKPVWGEFKPVLAAAQHCKCAYCEHKTLAGATGVVDHFRPKGEVTRLGDDPATWGRETEHLANVEGRIFVPCCSRGYWWLAYEWTNLRFVCERCNHWKGSLFPVADRPDGEAPDPNVTEVVLLLNPFGKEDPGGHLQFSAAGTVEPRDRSPVGFETIRTLGLDRKPLRDARQSKAEDAFRTAHRLMEATGEAFDEHLEDLLRLGRADLEYSGMVRIIVQQELGLTWDELESLQS